MEDKRYKIALQPALYEALSSLASSRGHTTDCLVTLLINAGLDRALGR